MGSSAFSVPYTNNICLRCNKSYGYCKCNGNNTVCDHGDAGWCFSCEVRRNNTVSDNTNDKVNHPSHYGGKDNPYEAIKVIEAWKLGFNLGNTVKYISRAGKKEDILTDLEKARFYLDREIANLKSKK